MNKEHSITITFSRGNLNYETPEVETKTFSFKTLEEVEAFRDGVWQMCGNDDYKVEGEEN